MFFLTKVCAKKRGKKRRARLSIATPSSSVLALEPRTIINGADNYFDRLSVGCLLLFLSLLFFFWPSVSKATGPQRCAVRRVGHPTPTQPDSETADTRSRFPTFPIRRRLGGRGLRLTKLSFNLNGQPETLFIRAGKRMRARLRSLDVPEQSQPPRLFSIYRQRRTAVVVEILGPAPGRAPAKRAAGMRTQNK